MLDTGQICINGNTNGRHNMSKCTKWVNELNNMEAEGDFGNDPALYVKVIVGRRGQSGLMR